MNHLTTARSSSFFLKGIEIDYVVCCASCQGFIFEPKWSNASPFLDQPEGSFLSVQEAQEERLQAVLQLQEGNHQVHQRCGEGAQAEAQGGCSLQLLSLGGSFDLTLNANCDLNHL